MKVTDFYTKGYKIYRIEIKYKSEYKYPSIISIDIYRELLEAFGDGADSEIIVTVPDIFNEEKADIRDIHNFYVATKRNEDRLKPDIKLKLVSHKEIESYSITEYFDEIIEERFPQESERESGDSTKEDSEVIKKDVKLDKRKGGTIRIDIERIEELGNLVGELIINRTQLDSDIISFMDELKDKRFNLEGIKSSLKQLGDISDRLRDLSLEVRMLPVSSLFKKFPRMVRDMAKSTGKRIELYTHGEDTELDKTIIEEINDPLVHLIRNSVDHGIENEAVRKELGKESAGRIDLRAYNEGNSIVIEIEDDGRGLNVEDIKKKAIERKLISEEESGNCSDKEIIKFIFLPGFSTAKEVSEISGRGVGLDVVKTAIERINGTIDVESIQNKGTKFILKLPLTLSIIRVLLVKSGKENYAVPLYSVKETSEIDCKKIRRIGRYRVIEKGDEIIPVFNLSEIFDSETNHEDSNDNFLIQLSVGNERFAIAVEDIIGQQEIVIKSLGSYMGKIDGIGGATILGDGKIILIIDVKGIASMIKDKMEAKYDGDE